MVAPIVDTPAPPVVAAGRMQPEAQQPAAQSPRGDDSFEAKHGPAAEGSAPPAVPACPTQPDAQQPEARSPRGDERFKVKYGPLVGPRGIVGPGGTPERPDTCRLFWAHGFCLYGPDCDFKHPPERSLGERDMETMLAELIQMGHQHARGSFVCMVCACTTPAQSALSAKVGETSSYAYCVTCGNFFFYPHVLLMVQEIMRQSGTDYTKYKRLIDSYARKLPSILSTPWYYEAHRWGTSRFAWTLTSVEDAKKTLEVVRAVHPRLGHLVSMGSGTGHVESVFVAAAREQGIELKVSAYDLTPLSSRRPPFEVTPKLGGVEGLDELGDMSDVVLLLCWPPFGSQEEEQSTMAFDCLSYYANLGGQTLVYIGDVCSTGDWRYHELLGKQWEMVGGEGGLPTPDTWVPEKMGLIYAGDDSIGVYRKRAHPVAMQFQWSLSPQVPPVAPPLP